MESWKTWKNLTYKDKTRKKTAEDEDKLFEIDIWFLRNSLTMSRISKVCMQLLHLSREKKIPWPRFHESLKLLKI